jgi:predicted transcriptional regulator
MSELARDPEELRQDIGEIRAELGATVEELAHRADVPARVKARKDETVERVQQQVAHVREVATAQAPVLRSSVRDNPVLVGAGALLAAVVAFLIVRRRSR